MKVTVIRVDHTEVLTSEIEVSEGTTVEQAVKTAGIKIAGHWLCVNGEMVFPEEVLPPNAELAITEPLMGG